MSWPPSRMDHLGGLFLEDMRPGPQECHEDLVAELVPGLRQGGPDPMWWILKTWIFWLRFLALPYLPP